MWANDLCSGRAAERPGGMGVTGDGDENFRDGYQVSLQAGPGRVGRMGISSKAHIEAEAQRICQKCFSDQVH